MPGNRIERHRRGACAAFAACLALFAVAPSAATAQTLQISNKSRLVPGKTQLVDTATLRGKRYSVGFTSTFREGRSLANAFSGRMSPTRSTTMSIHTALVGLRPTWEAKVNHKLGSFTVDLGGGSDGLFHTGLKYGKGKGKGFGFSASWIGNRPPCCKPVVPR